MFMRKLTGSMICLSLLTVDAGMAFGAAHKNKLRNRKPAQEESTDLQALQSSLQELHKSEGGKIQLSDKDGNPLDTDKLIAEGTEGLRAKFGPSGEYILTTSARVLSPTSFVVALMLKHEKHRFEPIRSIVIDLKDSDGEKVREVLTAQSTALFQELHQRIQLESKEQTLFDAFIPVAHAQNIDQTAAYATRAFLVAVVGTVAYFAIRASQLAPTAVKVVRKEPVLLVVSTTALIAVSVYVVRYLLTGKVSLAE